MKIQDIRDMFDYNDWANMLLLDKAAQVTPEQFVAPTSHSFGSLRGTLVHTLDSEQLWRLLLEDKDFRRPEMDQAQFPTVDSLRQEWQVEQQAMRAYLDSLNDDDLTRVVRYYVSEIDVTRVRVLWHCLFHVVNHGMQHRSEAAAMLTDYGHSPGEIDFTIFLNGRPLPQ